LKSKKTVQKKVHRITLEFLNGITRTVTIKASDREVAERRALKHNPSAIGVNRNA
jgi:hypothetical protein